MSCGKPCGCPSYRDHLLSISVAPSATPSRKGGSQVVEIEARQKRWDRDHAAYRRLRADGLQPRTSDRCGDLEQVATEAHQIEGTPVPA